MTRKVVVVGIAAGAVTAATTAVVVAVVKYRQGHPHTPEDIKNIEELKAHLSASGEDPETKKIAAFWRKLSERGAATPEVLHRLLDGLRKGQLNDEQADFLEAQLDHAEGHANRQDL